MSESEGEKFIKILNPKTNESQDFPTENIKKLDTEPFKDSDRLDMNQIGVRGAHELEPSIMDVVSGIGTTKIILRGTGRVKPKKTQINFGFLESFYKEYLLTN